MRTDSFLLETKRCAIRDIMLDFRSSGNGESLEKICLGPRTFGSGWLGKVLDFREEKAAKLVLANESIRQDQIQDRHLGEEIPGRVIQDQNQEQDQHPRIRH